MQNRPGSSLELDVVPPISSLPSNPHKGPKSTSAFEPVFENERHVRWRAFLILLSAEKSREGRKRGGKKRSFRASFSLMLYLLHFLPALSHLLEEKADFWKNSWSRQRRREQKSEGEKKKSKGETWLKESMKKEGALETAVGEVS